MSRRRTKPNINSAAGAVEVVQAALNPITPPENFKLDKLELDCFNEIIDELANSEWTKHRRRIAAEIAVKMMQLRRAHEKISKDGLVLLSKKTKVPYQHPLLGAAKTIGDSILAMRRAISLTDRGQGENAETRARRRATSKAIQDAVLTDDPDDEFLARPPKMN